MNYETAPGGYWYRGLPAWAHGYPLAEQNLMKIMNELSYLGAQRGEINTLALDDPELFKYPVAYIIEVSWWTLTDTAGRGAAHLHRRRAASSSSTTSRRPGDFGSPGWEPFEANMQRVLPDARFVEMQASHPIFHCFFEIETARQLPAGLQRRSAGVSRRLRGQRSEKRLQMIVNYNTDISQYWEWSGRGLRPFDETNEAYKLGVNYIMYGLTH